MAAEIFEQLIDLPFLLEQGDNCHCAAAFIADEGVYLITATLSLTVRPETTAASAKAKGVVR
mgnify:CR=1 FL=1